MALLQSRIVTYGARKVRQSKEAPKATTAEVALIRPVSTATTQADANEIFDDRLKVLETKIGGGIY